MVLSPFLKGSALFCCSIPFQFFLKHHVQLQDTQIQHLPPQLPHQRKHVHHFPMLYSLVTQIPRVFLYALKECLRKLEIGISYTVNRSWTEGKSMSGDSTDSGTVYSPAMRLSVQDMPDTYSIYIISDCDKLTKKTSFLQNQQITRRKK